MSVEDKMAAVRPYMIFLNLFFFHPSNPAKFYDSQIIHEHRCH